MAGKHRMASERAIIYAGILGGLSLGEIDSLLAEVGARSLAEDSYKMLRGTYFRSMVSEIGNEISHTRNDFGESIFHPKRLGDC